MHGAGKAAWAQGCARARAQERERSARGMHPSRRGKRVFEDTRGGGNAGGAGASPAAAGRKPTDDDRRPPPVASPWQLLFCFLLCCLPTFSLSAPWPPLCGVPGRRSAAPSPHAARPRARHGAAASGGGGGRAPCPR